ncbi:MAG: hypothetical protein HRT44_07500 [Bdellovibrionales bacterium]|nr:hypothetical protein [Bdellovibrionales bacterium]NQZ19083.1 hypothetical protein [Bdellovibrionales bacterium]
MFILGLTLIRLGHKAPHFQKWLISLFSLLFVVATMKPAQAEDIDLTLQNQSCESFALNNELESRYDKIRKNLEKDFNSGLPYQLKSQLISLRSDTDEISQKLFDFSSDSDQEVNGLVKNTIDRLEKFIQLLPEITQNAPKIRDQYVVPFTNISSLRAEHQECLMKMAIEQAQNDEKTDTTDSSSNIYEKLTNELNSLNANLYKAETTDVQQFIQLRAELLQALESYNKQVDRAPGSSQKIVKNIPKTLNAVQAEIEKLLPGLQLSKKYYSIVD